MLHFSEDTIGTMMDPFYPAYPADLTIADLGRRLQACPSKDFTCVFILDRSGCPVGVVRTHDVFLSEADQPVSAIASACDCRIHGTTDWRTVAGNPDLHRWNALPLVDDENRYIGALREGSIIQKAANSEAIRAGGSLRRTSLALGEIFRLGLTGMLDTIENPKD
jgi:Mg/Co/Ni transporter MgtE